MLGEFYRTDRETIRAWVREGPTVYHQAWDSVFPSERVVTRENVAQFYSHLNADVHKHALCYGTIYAYRYRPVYVLSDIYAVSGNEVILDFGCGGAHYALDLAARGCKVDLLDIRNELNMQWIQWNAIRLGVKYNFLEFDAELPREKYDIVLCLDVLEHLFEPYETLLKIHQALKLQGKLFFIAPFGADGREHIQAAVDNWNENQGEEFLRTHFRDRGGCLYIKVM